MKLFLNAKVMIIPLIRMIFSSCGKGGLELFALHFSFFFVILFVPIFFVFVSDMGAFHVMKYVSCHKRKHRKRLI